MGNVREAEGEMYQKGYSSRHPRWTVVEATFARRSEKRCQINTKVIINGLPPRSSNGTRISALAQSP